MYWKNFNLLFHANCVCFVCKNELSVLYVYQSIRQNHSGFFNMSDVTVAIRLDSSLCMYSCIVACKGAIFVDDNQ